MDDFNSMLESLHTTAANTEPSPQEVTFHLPDEEITVPIIHEEVSEESPTVSVPLSEDDVAEILTDNGYDPYVENQEEEEEGEEENTDTSTPRDLDAEEGVHVISENIQDLQQRADELLQRISDHIVDEDSSNFNFHIETAVRVGTADNLDVAIEHPADANNLVEGTHDSIDAAIVSDTITPTSEAIPENSPTLLIDNSTARFSGAEWYNEIQKSRIIIGGCGGIGSNLAFQIARMSPSYMIIYDDDTVETVNMAGQLFSRNDVGKAKVHAMADMLGSYTSAGNIFSTKAKFTNTTEPGSIMMCGFDNMDARKTFFHAWRKHLRDVSEEDKKKCLFLDGRLSIDTLQILCLTGDDDYNIDRYMQEYLFSDEEAEETVCSMKQTTYMACMIASIMTNLFVNFTANLLDPVIPYDLPFFTEYDAQNMIFKTEN